MDVIQRRHSGGPREAPDKGALREAGQPYHGSHRCGVCVMVTCPFLTPCDQRVAGLLAGQLRGERPDRSYFRSLYLPSLDERVIAEIEAGLADRPSEMTYSSVWYFGAVVRDVAADATAFGDRSQPWLLSIDAIWSGPEDDAANIGWVRQLWSTMRPFSNGRLYLNFLAADDDDHGVVRDGIGAATYERLARIKAKYDPTNFFRLNQNIVPA
jgi:hypothetical protein